MPPDSPKDMLDKLARSLADAVPEGLRSVRDDLEKNFRSVLQASLGKLDLVTREEFEVQQAVLARTREKLTQIEQKLDLLESRASKKSARKKPPKKKSAKKTARKTSKKRTKKKG